MIIQFKIGSYEYHVTNATFEDVRLLTKIKQVKNQWRSHHEAVQYDSTPSELCFLNEDDIKITGISEETNKQTISDLIKKLEKEASERWEWYQKENNKVVELQNKLNELISKQV